MSSKELADSTGESLERKAGRLLFIGLPVATLDRHWRALLREVRPGGVILFGRNIESAEPGPLLCPQIRAAAGAGVVVGVEQERRVGFRVSPIREPVPLAQARARPEVA